MKRRVLVSVFEIPGFGGSSTVAYALFSKMQRDGVDVRFASLVQPDDVPFYRRLFGERYANPNALANVYEAALPGALFGRQDAVPALLESLAPDVVLTVGVIATVVVGRSRPGVPLVHFVGGWPQTSEVSLHRPVLDGAALPERPLRSARRPTICRREEAESFAVCDLAIASSPLVKALYERVLPPSLSSRFYREPLTTAEWIADSVAAEDARRLEFSERPIDLLFVASSWTRWEKNFAAVRRIAHSLPHLRTHVVGECLRVVPGVTHYGLVHDRRRLFELMGRAKALVVPSLLDANPGVLFEAALMGANIVASKGCGNWMLCNEQLLVERPDDSLIEVCRRAAERPYPDHRARFRESGAYGKLLEALQHV
jgi:glycosyltransferase involved in cell wall biosynthesis